MIFILEKQRYFRESAIERTIQIIQRLTHHLSNQNDLGESSNGKKWWWTRESLSVCVRVWQKGGGVQDRWWGIPANMRHWPDVGLSLVHRLRRWPNNKSTLGQSLSLVANVGSGRLGMTKDSPGADGASGPVWDPGGVGHWSAQRWVNVSDADPTFSRPVAGWQGACRWSDRGQARK